MDEIAPDVWSSLRPQKLVAGLRIPTRMTIVRTDEVAIVYAPIEISPAAREVIGGRRAIIVAPNGFHHLYLTQAIQALPHATVYISPALHKRFPHLAQLPADAPSGFRWHIIGGAPRFSEIVVWHESSSTLLVTDLLFNMKKTQGLVTRLLLTMTGTNGRAAQSRLWGRMIRDRNSYQRSLQTVLTWPTERVIPCHGGVIDGGLSSHLRYT